MTYKTVLDKLTVLVSSNIMLASIKKLSTSLQTDSY